MSATLYEVWITTDKGYRIKHLDDLITLDYVKIVNGIGYFEATVGNTLEPGLLKRGRQIRVWRKPLGGSFKLDFVGILRKWKFSIGSRYSTTVLSGPDQNILLTQRIVAYNAGLSQTIANGPVDDEMKAVVRENLGSLAVAGRDLSSYGIEVQANKSLGATISTAFAWSNVMKVLQNMYNFSRQNAPEIFFGFYPVGIGDDSLITFEFRTYVNQPGHDRTSKQYSNPVIFGTAYGNLFQASLENDFSDEKNYVYVGGVGEGINRRLIEVQDSDDIAISVFGRFETFYNGSQVTDTDAALTDVGQAQIEKHRPVQRFNGALVDSEATRYGEEWGFGDKITVDEFGKQFDGIIKKIHVSVSPMGEEINGFIEGDDILL